MAMFGASPIRSSRRPVHLSRRAILAASLLLVAFSFRGVAAEKGPTAKEVKHALDTLELDTRDNVEHALDVLQRDGSKTSLEAITSFGARTVYTSSAVLAGEALAKTGERTAVKFLQREIRAQKKTVSALEHLALMVEQVPGKAGAKLLEKLARDSRESVAAIAVRALGHRKDESERDLLMRLLHSQREEVAKASAFALSRLKPEKKTEDLLFEMAQKAIKDRVCDVAALALARMDGAASYAKRALVLLPARAGTDSFHAMAKLAMRGTKAPDPAALADALKSGSGPVREVACDMIGLFKVKGFQKQLLHMALSEHDWRNEVAAWLALRRTGVDQVMDGVNEEILRSGEPSYWAIQCANKNPNPRFLPALRDAALDARDPVRRELAQVALRHAVQSRDETRTYFYKIVKDDRGTPKAHFALVALGNLRDATTFKTLVQLLGQEKDDRYKLWILDGLQKLTGHYYEPDPKIWNEWFSVVQGEVAFDPKPINRKENRKRVEKIKELGISPQTENAVERGLSWLARHQEINGGWNGATYSKRCIPPGACADQGGIRDRPLAYTGLALLAFQGAGYSHLDGPYRNVIQRGFEYILANQDYDGSHNEKGWTFSYEAAIVCHALCDGYALTGDPWLGEAAQHMIDYLVKIQYPGRAWRYHVRSSETDTSVMSWVVTACVSARHAGLDIPEQVFACAKVWLNKACDPVPPGEFEVFVRAAFEKSNRYFIDVSRNKVGKVRTFKLKTWYQPPRLYTPAMSAIGMLLRIWMGWTRAHPFCIGSANQVISMIPGYGTGLEKEAGFYPYTWYYGSLAMYQMGGRYWTRWREGCIDALIRHQNRVGCPMGSWKMPPGQFVSGLTGGTVYATAMSIMTLETFYRYQPYLSRFKLRSREEKEAKDKSGGKPAAKDDGKQDGGKSEKGGEAPAGASTGSAPK